MWVGDDQSFGFDTVLVRFRKSSLIMHNRVHTELVVISKCCVYQLTAIFGQKLITPSREVWKYFDFVRKSEAKDPYMGIPRSKPSFSSVIHNAKTSLRAVTPLTKDMWFVQIIDAGENRVFTNPAIAWRSRLEPNGPSW